MACNTDSFVMLCYDGEEGRPSRHVCGETCNMDSFVIYALAITITVCYDMLCYAMLCYVMTGKKGGRHVMSVGRRLNDMFNDTDSFELLLL